MNQDRAIELAAEYQQSTGPARKCVSVVAFSREDCLKFGLVWPSWSVIFEALNPGLRDGLVVYVQGDGKVQRRAGL